jgi:aminoglycoside phosphotransferase (APT) family kinase protein
MRHHHSSEARFHAAWWSDARLGAGIGTRGETSLDAMARQFEGFASGFGDRLPPERRTLHQKLLRSAPRLLERPQPETLVHGDAHAWNCFLPIDGGEVRLFDWDAWRIDHASDDLAYLMAVHWYPDLRRAFEARLLDAYHDELLSRGVTGYSRATLQEDYRVSVLWQLARAVWQQSIGIPPVIWWNNLERLDLAVDDLDCRALLD